MRDSVVLLAGSVVGVGGVGGACEPVTTATREERRFRLERSSPAEEVSAGMVEGEEWEGEVGEGAEELGGRFVFKEGSLCEGFDGGSSGRETGEPFELPEDSDSGVPAAVGLGEELPEVR